MNNEPDPKNPDPTQPPKLPVDPHHGGKRPPKGTIVLGVLLGLFGAPSMGISLLLFIANATPVHVGGGTVAFMVCVMCGLWFWSGWLTGAFARTRRARVGLALLFGLGYGVFPFAVGFAICGGKGF